MLSIDYHLDFHAIPQVTYSHIYEASSVDYTHMLGADVVELSYIYEGYVYAQAEGEDEIYLPANSVLVEVHDRLHRVYCPEHYKEANCIFRVPLTQLQSGGLVLPRSLTLDGPDNPISLYFRQMVTQFAAAPNSPATTALLFQLLGEISAAACEQHLKKTLGGELHVRKAKKYVAEHLHMPLQAMDVAAALDISASHPSRLFRRNTGMTLIGYINRLRMERVEKLILLHSMDIRSAGEQVGLYDPAYVSRLFKRIMGYCITDLRQSHILHGN
ncbi:MAG: helix-turn-helix transcriptional regulator [Ruminococcaceae bacterium]|nr:helix-turn-helix transcriptional regulator [Oscillospiraceae bacterium]